MGHLVAWLNIYTWGISVCGLMYSAGTSTEHLGIFSPWEAWTIQGHPWLLICIKRAFSIHKPSLPDQFSGLKCSDSWVPDPAALTSLKPLTVVLVIIIIIMKPGFYLCIYSGRARNTYPGFRDSCMSGFEHSDCVSLNIRIQINVEKIVFPSFKPF